MLLSFCLCMQEKVWPKKKAADEKFNVEYGHECHRHLEIFSFNQSLLELFLSISFYLLTLSLSKFERVCREGLFYSFESRIVTVVLFRLQLLFLVQLSSCVGVDKNDGCGTRTTTRPNQYARKYYSIACFLDLMPFARHKTD